MTTTIHRFMPKTPGDYRARQSYHMYRGRNSLFNILWYLGFWDWSAVVDGKGSPQREHHI